MAVTAITAARAVVLAEQVTRLDWVRLGKDLLVGTLITVQAALVAEVPEAREQGLALLVMVRAVMAALEQYRVLQEHLFNMPVAVAVRLMFPEVL